MRGSCIRYGHVYMTKDREGEREGGRETERVRACARSRVCISMRALMVHGADKSSCVVAQPRERCAATSVLQMQKVARGSERARRAPAHLACGRCARARGSTLSACRPGTRGPALPSRGRARRRSVCRVTLQPLATPLRALNAPHPRTAAGQRPGRRPRPTHYRDDGLQRLPGELRL